MRLLLLVFFLPPLFLITSCSSTGKKGDLLSQEEAGFLQAYAKAKSDKDCELLSKLSRENKFVLKNLALIRARMICSKTSDLQPLSSDVVKDLGPDYSYLRSLNEDRALIEAERSQDAHQLALAWKAKGMTTDRAREKVQFLQKALSFAEKTDDKKLAEDIQTRIYNIAPRSKPNPVATDYQKVGNDFVFNREFSKGREFYQKIMDSKDFSFDEQYLAHKAFRNSFKIEQNRPQFTLEAEKMNAWLIQSSQQKPEAKLIFESYMTWARSLWTMGQAEAAQAVLKKAEKKLRKIYPLDEIEFVRGKMAEENGDYGLAFDHFEKGQKINQAKGGGFRDRLLFSKAWSLRKLGRFADAAEAFEVLSQQTQDSFDQYRYQFWQARSLKQAGQVDKSLLVLHKLKDEDTLGYYGLLAHRELGEDLPPLDLQVRDSIFADSKLNSALPPEVSKTINALQTVGEVAVLEKYLNMKTQELKIANSQDSETWLIFLKAYAQAGLYLPLFSQLGTLETKLKTQLLKSHPDLLFPRKYLDLIKTWAEKFQVKPELMLAIIRQESAFNPLARSPADAFGLMQVLPTVAREHEKYTGIKIEHHEDLYNPETNIPVGASLLAQLGRHYRGQFVLTAAAYNASERAIEGWLKTRLRDDPLEFIEDIPYDETRSYVKLVIRNFIFYSRLNQPQMKLAFPSWCLEDLQSFKVSTR